MIYIAICDDEIELGTELENTLMDIFNELKIECEISVFFSGEQLQQAMKTGTHYDLIFLDIEFGKHKLSGVEVGQLIRKVYQNRTVSIVYISWEQSYSMQLFEMQPLNFLIKPLSRDKVEHTVKTYLQIAQSQSSELVYKKGHSTFKAQTKDIVYLENRGRKVTIHFSCGKKEEFYASLKELYREQLDKMDFLFIHASIVVNYDYVKTIKHNHLILADGKATTLPIASSKQSATKEKYLAIIRKRAL